MVFAKVQGKIGYHSSFLRYYQEIVCYGMDQALHYYLLSLLEAVHQCTAIFRFLSWSSVETQGKSLCKSSSFITSSLDQKLSSSAVANQWGRLVLIGLVAVVRLPRISFSWRARF